jgi:hypothetical protein
MYLISKKYNRSLKDFYTLLVGSMIAIAFQSAFRAEMYQNDVFLFFKNYF